MNIGASQEQLDLSNGYVPFGIAVSLGGYHDSILNVLAHLRNFKVIWEITIPRELILEMGQLSVSIYKPNLQVRRGFGIIVGYNQGNLRLPFDKRFQLTGPMGLVVGFAP